MQSTTSRRREELEGERYDAAADNAARFVAWFGPYILWGSMGVLAGLLFLLAR